MSRVKWIWSGLMVLLIPLIFASCASLFNPGADDPDSPGGEEITEEEAKQAAENARSAGSALGAFLSALGLGGIGSGIALAGSVAGNVVQWRNKHKESSAKEKYRDAAKRFSKTIENIKLALADLDLSDKDEKDIILQALQDAGAQEGNAKRVYRELEEQGVI